MIGLLAKIPYLRKQIYAYALRHKKADKFAGLELAFKDTEGRAYYQFSNDFDVFIKRKSFWDERLIELDAGLSGKEMDIIIEACMDAMNKPKPNYALVAHLVTEMKNRRQWLIHGEVMYSLLASCYVREDEDPAVVDMEIHNEKVAYFMANDDLSFFFDNRTINELLPFLARLKNSLKPLLSDTMVEAQALMKQIQQHTSAAE